MLGKERNRACRSKQGVAQRCAGSDGLSTARRGTGAAAPEAIEQAHGRSRGRRGLTCWPGCWTPTTTLWMRTAATGPASHHRLRMRCWRSGVRVRFQRTTGVCSAVLQLLAAYTDVCPGDDDLPMTGRATLLRHCVAAACLRKGGGEPSTVHFHFARLLTDRWHACSVQRRYIDLLPNEQA